MSKKSIRQRDTTPSNPFAAGVFDFPKDKDGIIYVRQSSLTQQQKNIHSFEMQTEKFLEHFRSMGCTGNIEIVADDEALSGTLDIHKRKGLARVVQMVEKETIGWIGAVHVNRLTRDPWLITPSVLMKLCYEHNVWIATLRMHFNFQDEYCQRVFMLEAEESARHLKWMKLILGGGRSIASDRGYYDGRYIIPGYIVDRTDELRKRYMIYEPHARIVRWLYRRFLELDGNFAQLCREVEAMPYLFPAFEDWVDKKTVSRFHMKQIIDGSYKGNYKPVGNGLRSILSNPTYIGWWLPIDGGVIEDNHEPIVDEVLFTYAHKRISTHDLNGQRQKPARTAVHNEVPAVLKKVLYDENGNRYYAGRPHGGLYRCIKYKGMRSDTLCSVPIRTIDSAFLEKFFERLQEWKGGEDWEEKVARKLEEEETREALITKQIKEAELKLAEITDTVNTPGCPKSMKAELFQQYEGLEQKKAALEKELPSSREAEEEQDEDEALFQIGTILPRLLTKWDGLPLKERLRFVGALVQHVILSHPSPGWLKMEIVWKRLDWQTDIAYIRRKGSGERWTMDEEVLLRTLYPTEDARDILRALPKRNWRAIKLKAIELGVRRSLAVKNSLMVSSDVADLSFEDIAYAVENSLVLSTKNLQWSN